VVEVAKAGAGHSLHLVRLHLLRVEAKTDVIRILIAITWIPVEEQSVKLLTIMDMSALQKVAMSIKTQYTK
jgi:hypothetical protein